MFFKAMSPVEKNKFTESSFLCKISLYTIGKNGEFAGKYLRKGIKIGIVGRIQTGSYQNKEGQRVYTTDIVVEEHEFCETKGKAQKPPTELVAKGFTNIPEGMEEELPFN